MITSPKSRTLIAAFVALAAVAHAQQYPKQAQLPNPYRLVENWPTVPQNMNGGRWGELIRADIDPKGNIWVFHRCFNTEPRRRHVRGPHGAADSGIQRGWKTSDQLRRRH